MKLALRHSSCKWTVFAVLGPLPLYLYACWSRSSSRRARRYPAWAHTGAVGGTPRLTCGAHTGVASRNPLCSLRWRRSDNRDESVHEARCARRLLVCAPRRPRDRPRRVPPSASQCVWLVLRTSEAPPQRRVGTGRSAPVVRREGKPRTRTVQWTVRAWRATGPLARRGLQGQGLRPRAQRESSTYSSWLSERRARSERSEFRDGAARASIARQPSLRADRTSEALRPVPTHLCRRHRRQRPYQLG